VYTTHNDPRFPEQRRLYLNDGQRWITSEELLQLFMKGSMGYSRIPIEQEIHALFDMFPAS